MVEGLARYVSFDNTRSGRARKNAESDLNERITKIEAKENISTAWESLLDGTSDKLVNLLIEETSLISSAPERSDVEKFLKSLKSIKSELGNVSRKKPKEPKPKDSGKASSGEVQFSLLGEQYTENNAVNAYVRIMEILAAEDRGFLERLAPLFVGRKNKWLSQNRQDIGFYKQAKEVSPGWWLDTHLSNEDKLRRLRTACKVAEIPFGNLRGLKITF